MRGRRSEAALERQHFAEMHFSVTSDRVIEACKRRRFSLDNPGFCLACGNEAHGCDPDARRARCEACGEMAVYGCEEVLLAVAL